MSDTAKGFVHCMCCNKFISQRWECEHCLQAANFFANPTNPSQSLQHMAYLTAFLDDPLDSDVEDEDKSQNSSQEELTAEDVEMFNSFDPFSHLATS